MIILKGDKSLHNFGVTIINNDNILWTGQLSFNWKFDWRAHGFRIKNNVLHYEVDQGWRFPAKLVPIKTGWEWNEYARQCEANATIPEEYSTMEIFAEYK